MKLEDLFKTKEPTNYVEQASQGQGSPLQQFLKERTPKPVAIAAATPRAAAPIEQPQVDQIKAEYSPVVAEASSANYSMEQMQRTKSSGYDPEMLLPPQSSSLQPQSKPFVPVSELVDVKGIKSQVNDLLPAKTEWSDVLANLTPLAVEAIFGGDQARSVASGISGEAILGDLTKKQKSREDLETRLMEIQKTRALAAEKKDKEASKLYEALSPEGSPVWMTREQAIGSGLYKTPSGRRTLEEEMSLLKYKAGLRNQMEDYKAKAKKSEEVSKKEMQLGKERTTQQFTTDTKKVVAAYNNLIGIDPNSKDPIRDIGVVFEFMKTLDPGSVVRESEQSLVMGAKSVGDFVNNLQDMMTKERKLTPEQIENIKRFSALNYSRRLQAQKSVVDERYLKLAKKYNLDPSVIADSLSVGTPVLWTDKNSGKTKVINVPDDQLEEVLKLPGAQRVE